MHVMITLSSDFGVQTQGVGLMEAVIHEINPDAKVVHLFHGLPNFDTTTAAWALESVFCLKPGIHVCVVDPGVGTERRAIIIQSARGDYLVGPDNGVLLPAARLLGGVKNSVVIENERFMRKPISPVFHGRDIFSPAAAYLSLGVRLSDFGRQAASLSIAPYDEARIEGDRIIAKAIHINKFGSVHTNILHEEFDRLGASKALVQIGRSKHTIPYRRTFGEVPVGEPLVFKDDYRRIELAVNQGDFSKAFKVRLGDRIIFHKI
jgi:S-adenosyl-L-methionine hydrolase (adenosine-forming)